jgi:hypothetical protein
MKTMPLQIRLPARAHQALRIFALTEHKTATKVVLEAIDSTYPGLRIFDATDDAPKHLPQTTKRSD